jgi:5-methylcytosine-specific restriction enzyme subunit McrC
MQIPIRNLYVLLLYAWDALDLIDSVMVGEESLAEPRDLLANVLLQGCNHVLRRGIDHYYAEEREETALPRGRIDFSASVRLRVRRSNQVAVEYEEWSPDTPANRVLKAALWTLMGVSDLPVQLRVSLGRAHRQFGAVTQIPLSKSAIERVRLHRNNRVYRLLMDVSRMIEESVIPNEMGTGSHFRDMLRDEGALRRLFQRFVYNFLRREQKDFRISAEVYGWTGERVEREGAVGLPKMHTDVVLRANDRTIVLDTKFTPRAFSIFRGSTTVRPDHTYQIFAYMSNLRQREAVGRAVEGILLYPSTDPAGFDLHWHIDGMALRVTSVNLAAEWPVLKASLLNLRDVPPQVVSPKALS